MYAIRAHAPGAPDVLTYEEVETPRPGPHQVLVRVEAASVNFADVMRRRGDVYPFPTAFPYTPGSEVAGTVAALGEGLDGPPVGSPVFAFVGDDGSTGYAEYAVAAAPRVVPLPEGVAPEAACGLGVAGATAMLMLTEVARLQPGESVVVPAAAGGVGGVAVQLAQHLGAGLVVGLASTAAKRDAARALGADLALDAEDAGWPAAVRDATDGRGADVVLEMAGGAAFDRSLEALAPFGRLVVYGRASRAPLSLDASAVEAFFYRPAPNQSLHAFNVGLWFATRPQEVGAALQRFIGLVLDGTVRVSVGAVLPLAEAAEAHRRLEARATTGKLVLRPAHAANGRAG